MYQVLLVILLTMVVPAACAGAEPAVAAGTESEAPADLSVGVLPYPNLPDASAELLPSAASAPPQIPSPGFILQPAAEGCGGGCTTTFVPE